MAYFARTTTGAPGSRFLTINQPLQSAPSRSRFRIRTSSTSGAAKDFIGPICPSATASTNQPMRAKPGRISACAMASKSRRSRSIPAILGICSWPWPDTPTGLTSNVVSSCRQTAARLSRRHFTRTRTRAAMMCRSIRPIRRSFTLRSGKRAKVRGKTRNGTGPTAAFSNRPMAARLGSS